MRGVKVEKTNEIAKIINKDFSWHETSIFDFGFFFLNPYVIT